MDSKGWRLARASVWTGILLAVFAFWTGAAYLFLSSFR